MHLDSAVAGSFGELLEDLETEAASRHPIEVLLDAVNRTSAMVQVLGALVGGLDPSGRAAATGDEAGVAAIYGSNHLGDGAPHVLTEMYATWIDRAARASKLALDSGIDERRVRLEESRGRTIAELFQRVFSDPELGLSAEQQSRARVVAARHMRALAAGVQVADLSP